MKLSVNFSSEFVASGVLDLEPLEIEDVRDRHAGQTVKLSRVLDQVFPHSEFVVAFNPGDAGARETAAERAQDFLPGFNLALELLAAARREVARNLPEVLEVAVEDQPVGALAAKKELEKRKRPFVVKGNLKIIGDDDHLIEGSFHPMSQAWQVHRGRRGGRDYRIGTRPLAAHVFPYLAKQRRRHLSTCISLSMC